MSDTKFTPGPWEYEEEDYPERGGYQEPRVFSYSDLDSPHLVCTIAVSSAVSSSMESNGNLIAAAPDLYAVAAAMVADDAFADLCAGIGEEPDWLKAARTALAKARGEEPKP